MKSSRCRALALLSFLLLSPVFAATPAQEAGKAFEALQQKVSA